MNTGKKTTIRSPWWLGRNRPPLAFLVPAVAAGVVTAVPIVYVLAGALSGGADTWRRLLDGQIPVLLWNTGILTLCVTFASVVVGTLLAFIVVRTDIPGARHLRWLVALPMAVPPYAGALSFILTFGSRGMIAEWTGRQPVTVYDSLFFTSVVLTLFRYPYVYLIVMSSLRRMSRSYEETARSCGLSYPGVLLKVTLPMLRPAVGAGALLVAFCVLSDFGAVAMLRYETFVSAIYYQIEGRFDRSGAAVLSAVLIAITLLLLWIERRGRRGRRYSSASEREFRDKVSLGKWKPAAVVFVFFVFSLGVLLPVGVLFYWSMAGLRDGALTWRFFVYILNSLTVAGAVAAACMVFTLPVVYLRSRYPSGFSRIITQLCFAGYALPGVIVALGMIFVFHRFLPWLYPTLAMLVVAQFVRFLPQGLGAGESAITRVPPVLDEAARSLGTGPFGLMRRVVFPLMMPGVLAGGALVFVSSLKELPATLLLRPPGYDTLSVRIWIDASEGFYTTAAPKALFIIAVAALSLKLLLDRYH